MIRFVSIYYTVAFEYTDRGLCIGLRDRETDFPPASTCGILSQDRRHKFIPLDSSCRINRTSAARIYTRSSSFFYTCTRAPRPPARACTLAGGSHAFVQSTKADHHVLQACPVSRIIMKKKKKKKERCCYSILQLLDFLIPGNNRENISPPPCSSFVPLPRRTPRRLATVYQLAVSRFSFYTFFFPPFETTLLAAYIIIPSCTVLFIILSLIETASLAGVVFGYGQGVS